MKGLNDAFDIFFIDIAVSENLKAVHQENFT